RPLPPPSLHDALPIWRDGPHRLGSDERGLQAGGWHHHHRHAERLEHHRHYGRGRQDHHLHLHRLIAPNHHREKGEHRHHRDVRRYEHRTSEPHHERDH